MQRSAERKSLDSMSSALPPPPQFSHVARPTIGGDGPRLSVFRLGGSVEAPWRGRCGETRLVGRPNLEGRIADVSRISDFRLARVRHFRRRFMTTNTVVTERNYRALVDVVDGFVGREKSGGIERRRAILSPSRPAQELGGY